MMSRDDMLMAEAAGADAIGFVTEYPVPVPWNLTREKAAELLSEAPPFLTTVAVVGGSPERMVEIALKLRPRILQLHGDETLEEIRQVLEGLEGSGIRVIKALRVDVDTGLARFKETDPVRAMALLSKSGISALVVDSRTSSMPAGTGSVLDWDKAALMVRETDLPLILAGGLNAGNVAGAVAKVKPYAVDVISGIESKPGVKDPEKIHAFVAAAKGINLKEISTKRVLGISAKE
jgi:phosphoribosylanthranilate isomerase